MFHKVGSWATAALVLTAGALFSGVTVAQEVLPVPPAPFKGQIGLSAKDSKSDFPKPVRSPESALNIVIVLLDDVGFGASSTFGGPIETPTLERLGGEERATLYTVPHHGAMLADARRAADRA